MNEIKVPVSPGELLDKITILRIKAARMVFPRIYIDPTARKRDTGWLGGARLIECLKHYRRGVPITTNEPGSPVHNQYSHGADAFGAMAEVIDQIVNDADAVKKPTVAPFVNSDPTMGLLG